MRRIGTKWSRTAPFRYPDTAETPTPPSEHLIKQVVRATDMRSTMLLALDDILCVTEIDSSIDDHLVTLAEMFEQRR